VSPGWRIGLDIAKACFPELDLVDPPSPAVRRRSHTAAIDELRAEHYNAAITEFEPTHSDLWVLRVRPDQGETSHLPGQYASLGLGFWEERIDDADDPNLDQRWDRLIRRSYSISSRIFDDQGYLADDTTGNELEFYVVLVPPTDGNVPALTPRLALKRPGDRIYLGPKVAGRYTLASVTDPEAAVVFLATGTGEAPHNAMIVELLRKGHVGPIVSAVSVRQWADLGYLDKHRRLEQRYANYRYLPIPTREPDVPKRYIQDLITGDGLAEKLGGPLDPCSTHVFLCGNPAMIGLPGDAAGGAPRFPQPTGVVELLVDRRFTLDRRRQPGNIHYEEYW
jgi:ferredoxin--NADP+ reductase